jgi:hypothetical protein
MFRYSYLSGAKRVLWSHHQVPKHRAARIVNDLVGATWNTP